MRATKPDKPRKDFPLTAHPNGTWCKKIKGKLYHFGGWSDPETALKKYLHDVDALQAGRVPDPMPGKDDPEELTLVSLCEQFLDSKQLLVESGDLSQRMLFDYHKSCKRLLSILGKGRVVENLKPIDFDNLRSKLAVDVGKTTLSNRIRMARILFKFAYDQDLIDKPLKMGQNFKLPDKSAIRAERNKQGPRMFEADELRSIIELAKSPLKAMILLGINCGFGQTDCATLPLSAIDLKNAWVTYPRPKTHVERRCPLWPETVAALKRAIARRPAPKNADDADLVFLTKYGVPFVRLGETGAVKDAVAGEFYKILGKLDKAGARNAFYSLRRTFETIGGDACDQIAVDHIMGHAPSSNDMGAVYRQRIDDDRLHRVAKHVRSWLWPKPAKKAVPKSKTQ